MSLSPDLAHRLAAMKFRAWHRGTREADYILGGFFDTFHARWSEADISWFETLLNEEDVDILGWALGSALPPDSYAGPLMDALRKLDFVQIG
jgi:antitoxin CptB